MNLLHFAPMSRALSRLRSFVIRSIPPGLILGSAVGISGLTVSAAPVNVLTYHNDVARLGANTNETILTPATVAPANFGQIIHYPVDGYVYAQPLVLTGQTDTNGQPLNLVFVATQHDSVYAFNADSADGPNGGLVWHTSFINPAANITTVPSGDTGSGDIQPEVGITATPVIDAVAGVIYVEAKTKEPGNRFVHRLHALDVRTGNEMPGSPVVINATSKGTGDGSDGRGNVPFNSLRQMARPALTLVTPPGFANPVVYISYASHGDNGPYHGWVLGYDAKTLVQLQSINVTPNGGLGGFWMAGNGPTVDANGNLYLITGNGTFTGDAKNLGDSYVKLSTTNANLVVADWFTPFNQDSLNAADADLGSGGTLLLPDSVGSSAHPHLLVGCGKEGKIYLLDRDSLGHFHAGSDNQIVQSVPGVIGGTWSSPAFFKNRIYYQGAGDTLKALAISNAAISPRILFQSPQGFGFPGATPTISANGDQNGIAWVIQSDGFGSRSPAVLHAYDAENLQNELYNSNINLSRDNPGPAAKFVVPTVANGHVYVGSGNALAVYGIGNWVAQPVLHPPGGQFQDSIQVTITDATPGAEIHYTTDGTEPNRQSTLYTGSLTLTNSSAVRAKAFKVGMTASSTALGTYLGKNSVGNGIGLKGDYYSNHLMSFVGNPTLTRIDPVVDFDWGGGSPDPSISADHFTVRWTGTVKAQFTEPYTFYVTSDDGVRLWVNGQKLVDAWVDQGPTEYSGTINLVAGQKYNVQIDYYENGGGAVCHFEWSSPSTSRDFVPTSQLFPGNKAPSVTWLSPSPGFSVTGPASITLAASASDSDGFIGSVAFYNGPKLIGSITNPPYTLTWTKVQPGSYDLSAVATDNQGATATNLLTGIQVIQGSTNQFGMEGRGQIAPYLNLPPNPTGDFPALLSETGAFIDVPTLAPCTGLIAYGVNHPFWSDGARKQRWMGVPYGGGPIQPAQQVAFDPDAPWRFPVGSVFVKHFDLQTNELNTNSLRRLETRILVASNNGIVYGATYRWRSDYTDADLVNSAETEDITITTATGTRIQTWYYPSRTDCVTCHTAVSGGILGASHARQLNGNFTYIGSGRTDNQLRTLNHIGLFYPAIDEATIPNMGRYADINDTTASISIRARSFLDVNCSYCHQPGGVRANFDTRMTTAFTNANIVDGELIAPGDIPNSKVLVRGDQLRSMIVRRMESLDPLIKMPPVGRNVVDTAAVDVVSKWIDLLAGPAPSLAVTPKPGLIHLTWPTTRLPFYLELSDSLEPGAKWVPGPQGTLINGHYEADVPVSASGTPGFQRLSSQQPLP